MVDISAQRREEVARWESLSRWERSELGRDLRRRGLSYGEIMDLIPVPKGTLAGWCREIELTPEQVAAIKERHGPRAGPRDTQWKRRLEIEQIQEAARRVAAELLSDPFWVAGVVMYWGEGSKTKRLLQLTNSDPRALRLFMRWVEAYLDADPEWVAALNLHADNNEAAARAFWQFELGVGERTFTKTYVKPDGTGHRKNHLGHGVCRVTLRRSTDAFIRTMTWIGAIGRDWASIEAGDRD